MEPFTTALNNMAEKRTLVAKKVFGLGISSDLEGTAWKDAEKYSLLAKDGTPAEYERVKNLLATAVPDSCHLAHWKSCCLAWLSWMPMAI